jgi:FixJ family two-component response regulator
MDGLVLQRRLAEIGQKIPIIFLSARASQEEEKRAWRAGAVEFLRKPVSKEALLRAIHCVFESQTNNVSKEL